MRILTPPTYRRGFTMVELLIVIAVLAILSAIVFSSMILVQRDARDKDRQTKISIITETLERYYDRHGEYPGMHNMRLSNSDGALTALLDLKNPEALRMPQAASSVHNSFGNGTATPDKPVYTGLPNITLCTTQPNGACESYIITWVSESDGIVQVKSRRGQL